MRLGTGFWRKAMDHEKLEEMQPHIAARRELGNVALLQEEGRDARGARWIESVAGDIRFALRYFARKPLTMVAIILVSSIGIGVHAAVFSLIQSVTTRPAPGVPRDDALVAIRGKERLDGETKWRPRAFSYPEFRDLADQGDVFASVAGWTRHYIALDVGDGDGRMAQVQFVTSGFFSTIGIRPILGAGLPPDDHHETGEPQLAVVIGHTLWSTSFASSPEVIGKSIRVNDVAVRIVGVAPPRFNGAVPTSGTRTLWMPLSARAVVRRTTASALASRDSAILETVGRLRPDVTIAQADARVRVVDARSTEHASLADGVMHAADAVALRGNLSVAPTNETAIMTAVFEAMALLILLITCTNVSALVVGAGVTRRHESATRLSLGASRGRLVRQLLTESSLLALAGGASGLLVYWWIAKLLAVHFPKQDISPDLTTVAFTMCVAAATGILFGLSPALHATRCAAADALKESAGGAPARSRLQRALVVAQIALTQPLLVGLGVTVAIVLDDAQSRPNADVADQTISVAFTPPFGIQFYARDAGRLKRSDAFREQAARTDAALRRVAALPGVVGVIPSAPGHMTMELTVVAEDRSTLRSSSMPVDARVETTSPEYFDLLDIPVVRGRALVATDTADRDVPLVIGSHLAHDLWGTEDPIGKRFERKRNAADVSQRYIVVGVYDSRRGMASGSQPLVYAPMSERLVNAYLIRTAGPAAVTIASVQSILREEIRGIPISILETLAERDEANRAEALRLSGAAGGGGVLALLLASIGLYGVVALALGQRRREIGIRIALGAHPRQVVQMLFRSGLRLSLTGLLLGLPLSMIAMSVAAAEMRLPDVNLTVVGPAIAVLVIAVASVATWLPARRAAIVDPMITLRAE